MPKSVIRTTIKIPKNLNKAERLKLSESIISYIQIRSTEGYDKNGNKFVKYSKAYADKKGVGVKDVDLVLSGEMLDSLSVIKDGSGFIEIGYKDSDENAGKAEGNILGSYGAEPDKSKARDFLGIDPAELEIMADVIDSKQSEISNIEIDELAKEAAREIFGDIEFE